MKSSCRHSIYDNDSFFVSCIYYLFVSYIYLFYIWSFYSFHLNSWSSASWFTLSPTGFFILILFTVPEGKSRSDGRTKGEGNGHRREWRIRKVKRRPAPRRSRLIPPHVILASFAAQRAEPFGWGEECNVGERRHETKGEGPVAARKGEDDNKRAEIHMKTSWTTGAVGELSIQDFYILILEFPVIWTKFECQ